MADNLKFRKARNTQLNEKVSPTQYDVLYPETVAGQVITNDNRMFVTKQQIDEWTKGKGSLHFRGSWLIGADYVKGDIVEHKGHYFIAGIDHLGAITREPDKDLAQTIFTDANLIFWYNIDYLSNLADKAKELKTQLNNSQGKFFLTFVDTNNSDANVDTYEKVYTNVEITYEPAKATLTVPNIIGTITEAKHALKADNADHATEAEHSKKSDLADTAVNYKNTKNLTTGKSNIQEAFEGIHKRIDGITDGSGGVVLGNSLFIKKNGSLLNPDGFNGSVEQTINITIEPKDVQGLLNGVNKIDNKWLPDVILGNLRYCGTVRENGIISSNDPEYHGKNIENISAQNNVGIYFLAAFEDPKASAKLVNIDDVRTGDWLVSNGRTGWVKIDNTDAVTMVNNQIGSVQTYKGDWKAKAQYYKGDIIKWQNALYIVNRDHNTEGNWESVKAFYDIFGRVYSAADGIKLEGTTFKHSTSVKSEEAEDIFLTYGDVFTVPSITLDAFGHTTGIKTYNFTLPALIPDTWRPVVVGGQEVLTKDNTSGKLIFNNSDKIKAIFENGMLSLEHEKVYFDGGSFEGTVNSQSPNLGEKTLRMGNGFTIPEFDYDVYGHITAVRTGTYRLPEGTIEHNHFEVVTQDGISTVKAYGPDNIDDIWVKNPENEGKFYIGDSVPTQRLRMIYNGVFGAREFQQNSNGEMKKVLDAGTYILTGKKLNGREDIFSSYDQRKNIIELGDSGVLPGTYSAIAVNSKGIVTYGGAILEFGHISPDPSTNEPSASLAVGGLFFRQMAATV